MYEIIKVKDIKVGDIIAIVFGATFLIGTASSQFAFAEDRGAHFLLDVVGEKFKVISGVWSTTACVRMAHQESHEHNPEGCMECSIRYGVNYHGE